MINSPGTRTRILCALNMRTVARYVNVNKTIDRIAVISEEHSAATLCI